ncbi:winged helix-turn-helix transcriptional regulator [Nocardioides sp. NPDC059952]|uniref:winged helix-turn-helix transcriptional regulator n=1 Tax=Nocardioides sp. NPDC059952 TaxID=3347014 RepID=UPI00364E0593
MRRDDLTDADCGIAQALGVIGDWQSLLIVRECAAGVTRFDGLVRELGLSRRALTERLNSLVADDVLAKHAYTDRPLRYDYQLTGRGRGLLPVLVALQEWGTRYVMGDGSLTATAGPDEERRLEDLLGTTPPDVEITSHRDTRLHMTGEDTWTVVFFFPGAYAPKSHGYPPGWGDIPGTRGCTLECQTYAELYSDFTTLGARVVGVSTQRPDQLAAFAEHADLPYDLASDADGVAAGAYRLPVFRAGGADRLKRVSLLLDPAGVVRHVQAPITDPGGSVEDMLTVLRERTSATDATGPRTQQPRR